MRWMKQRHGYELQREEICFIPNVVVGLAYAIQTISKPGDEIIVQTPAYGPFFEVVKDNNRVIVENRMKNETDIIRWIMRIWNAKLHPGQKQ